MVRDVGFLSRFFDSTHRLMRLARGNDRPAFARALVETDVIVLCAITHPGIPAEELTQEALLKMIAESASELSAATTFQPFVYDRDGRPCTPLFSSAERAAEFVGAFQARSGRVYPFQTITVRGATVATVVENGECVVLDDGAEDAYELSAEDRRLLASMRRRASDSHTE